MTTQEVEISPKTLLSVLRYDSSTGKLFWRERQAESFKSVSDCATWNKKCFGKEAFKATHIKGYKWGSLFGKKRLAHRVIWAMHQGNWPIGEIDHINGDMTDNRIENLRDVTPVINSRNSKMFSNNTSGHCGVHWDKRRGKWAAQITIKCKKHPLGHYDSIDQAIAARKAAQSGLSFTERHGK